MKTTKILLQKIGGVAAILLFATTVSFGQDESSVIKNMIETQNYVFKAQTVNPASGRTRQLTTEYDLKVSKEEVVAYLPYFGRAYSAPADLTGGGVNFTSMQFEYNVSQGKKGRWEITIKPKDVTDVRELSLTVFENGKSDLHVISNRRQPISFNGYITNR